MADKKLFPGVKEYKKTEKTTDIYNEKIQRVEALVPQKNSLVGSFLGGILLGQLISIVSGSIGWNVSEKDFAPPMPSYVEAFKHAYGIGNWENEKDKDDMAFRLSVNIILTFGVALLCLFGAQNGNQERKKQLEIILSNYEKLKIKGINVKKLIKDMGPIASNILSSLSEIDRGYFENLVNGGLNKADYETCAAILGGYLKTHPEDYEKAIMIFDEATLPQEIKEKYGKGKTISFGAATKLNEIKR